MRRPVGGVDAPCPTFDSLSRHAMKRSSLRRRAEFRNNKLIRRASALFVATRSVQRDPVPVMVESRPPGRRGDKTGRGHEDHEGLRDSGLRNILATVDGYQGPPRFDVKPVSVSAVPISRKLLP